MSSCSPSGLLGKESSAYMTSSAVAHKRVSSLRLRRCVERRYEGSILAALSELGAVNGSHSVRSTAARLSMKPSME